mgnify:CR=1 FL=1
MSRRPSHPLLHGTAVTALGTLASRVLGMLRDTATAALLGLAAGGVADAFLTAYRIPNLLRRMFGEGALTASYLPVFTAEYARAPQSAWNLAAVLLSLLAIFLGAVVVLSELLFGLLWLRFEDWPDVQLMFGLAAVMMPYLMLVCLAAQISATLQARMHFGVPALTPVVLNLSWLAAAWLVAPRVTSDPRRQAYVLAAAIVFAGVMQVLVQLPALWASGFRWSFDLSAAWTPLRTVVRNLLPMLFGLAVTQINTFVDGLLAWGLSRAPHDPEMIPWLGDALRYPLQRGAAAAVYYSERVYEFPLGILGMAVATAIFPLLSQHAARNDRDRLGQDLSLGLRMVLFLGLPAGVGLMLLAAPVVELLFQRGEFTAADAHRAANMLFWYSASVWAYCATPVVIRAFYALGQAHIPVRVAAGMVVLNISLNLLLIWPFAEVGLALSTAICGVVQLAWLVALLVRRRIPLEWTPLAATAVRTIVATGAMAAATAALLWHLEPKPEIVTKLMRVVVPVLFGIATYCAAYLLVGRRELTTLLVSQQPGHSPFDAD